MDERTGGAGQFLEVVDEPALVVEEGMELREWNDAAEDLFPDLIMPSPGDDLVDLLGESAVEAVEAALDDAGNHGRAESELGGHVDGYYELRVYPCEAGYAVLLEEITERYERRKELERYETVLMELPDPVYILDEHGGFEFANEALADMSGFSTEEFMDGAVAGMGMRAEDVRRGQELIREMLSVGGETGDWRSFEQVIFTKDGERIPCENRMAILVDDGEFQGTAGTVHEITDRRRQQERLQVLERVLRHNLRTEATLVYGHLDRILAATDVTEVEDAATEIRDAVERLVGFGDKTRRIGSAIVGAELTTIDLGSRLEEIVGDLAEEHPEATFEVDADASPTVKAGPSLDGALEELLENAVVHNDVASPMVTVTVETVGANVELEMEDRNDQVLVAIADDGPGIPEHERAVVTGEGTTSPLEHSDGLGLWMAAWIVQEYGGKIEISDRDPRGTVVEVYLTVADGKMRD